MTDSSINILNKMSNMEDWKGFVSTTATISTLINFLTGLQVVRGFLRKGTSGEASGLPFVAGALNCGIWFKYALLIDDTAMKLVNGIGVLLLSSSSAIFYKYTPNRTSVLKQIVFAVGFFVTISFYVNSMNEELGHARYILGLVGDVLAVCYFGAPLAAVAHVIRTGSTEVLPFPIILSSWFVTGQWWIYGNILEDNFVKVPNCLGWCLATFQLLLFVYFPNKRKNSLLPMATSE